MELELPLHVKVLADWLCQDFDRKATLAARFLWLAAGTFPGLITEQDRQTMEPRCPILPQDSYSSPPSEPTSTRSKHDLIISTLALLTVNSQAHSNPTSSTPASDPSSRPHKQPT